MSASGLKIRRVGSASVSFIRSQKRDRAFPLSTLKGVAVY